MKKTPSHHNTLSLPDCGINSDQVFTRNPECPSGRIATAFTAATVSVMGTAASVMDSTASLNDPTVVGTFKPKENVPHNSMPPSVGLFSSTSTSADLRLEVPLIVIRPETPELEPLGSSSYGLEREIYAKIDALRVQQLVVRQRITRLWLSLHCFEASGNGGDNTETSLRQIKELLSKAQTTFASLAVETSKMEMAVRLDLFNRGRNGQLTNSKRTRILNRTKVHSNEMMELEQDLSALKEGVDLAIRCRGESMHTVGLLKQQGRRFRGWFKRVFGHC